MDCSLLSVRGSLIFQFFPGLVPVFCAACGALSPIVSVGICRFSALVRSPVWCSGIPSPNPSFHHSNWLALRSVGAGLLCFATLLLGGVWPCGSVRPGARAARDQGEVVRAARMRGRALACRAKPALCGALSASCPRLVPGRSPLACRYPVSRSRGSCLSMGFGFPLPFDLKYRAGRS